MRAAAEVTGDRENWRWIVQPHIVSKPVRRETRGMNDDATLSTHTHTHTHTEARHLLHKQQQQQQQRWSGYRYSQRDVTPFPFPPHPRGTQDVCPPTISPRKSPSRASGPPVPDPITLNPNINYVPNNPTLTKKTPQPRPRPSS